MYSLKDKEGTIINNVREDFFADYDCRKLIGNIDFSVAIRKEKRDLFPETEYLLWAEAKQGCKHSIYDSFIQLILTIGKERTIDKNLPPKFIGAFDAEKIAFIPYSSIMEVFSQNDFNWNVTPSDHESKEFRQLKELVRRELNTTDKDRDKVYVFYFDNDKKELQRFIKHNFVSGRDSIQRIRVNHNNFKAIYERWRQEVKPTIAVDWDNVKKSGLLDADFYLADLMAENNLTLLDNLNVLLQATHYEVDRKLETDGLWSSKQVQFKDMMQAHTLFWCKYARPPKREYWDRIVERRDLLVPQDIRERKGSYFTPAIWVQKSQEYLEAALGENWQEEYYVWDCCAGTGNLLAGLTNKYNIWASTLDKSDVDVMMQRIDEMGAGSNLLKSHVFQFDFLNDSFDRLPQGLQDIINDSDKRKRLVIYINPPYAEAGSATQVTGSGENKTGVSNNSLVWQKHKDRFGLGIRELYVQFFIRIYDEIPSCTLAEFSTLKILQGSAFEDFRSFFKVKLLKAFIVPASTFDNVKGSFPIGFFIWDTSDYTDTKGIVKECTTLGLPMSMFEVDVYDHKGELAGRKAIASESDHDRKITSWISAFGVKASKDVIGYTGNNGPDYQNNIYLHIGSEQKKLVSGNLNNATKYSITKNNLIPICVYFSIRLCMEATWLNDRDQFLYPNDGWREDKDFQRDCLAYTLFHGQNRITSEQGINHWIPFTEQEVDAPDNFQSHFMSDFIKGKLGTRSSTPAQDTQQDLFSSADETLSHSGTQTARLRSSFADEPSAPLTFTPAAQAVMDAGKALWYYYLHHKPDIYGAAPVNVNASFYDIRVYFQGRDEKGRMNSDSRDEEYMRLLRDLRSKQKTLASQIAEKVYLYGFLK